MISGSSKRWIKASAVLIAIGVVILSLTACAAGFDMTKLLSGKYVTNTYTVEDDFDKIIVDIEDAGLDIALSENGECKVVCYEKDRLLHSVSVVDGALRIDGVSDKKWYDNIAITADLSIITVYLPEAQYSSLAINTATGDVRISEGFNFGNADINASTADISIKGMAAEELSVDFSTGDLMLEDIECASFSAVGSTGDTVIKNLSVAKDALIKRSTGDIELLNAEVGGALTLKVTTGNMSVNGLACASLSSDGSSGDVTIENADVSGSAKIERSTGKVTFKDSYAANIEVKVNTGDITLSSFDAEEIYVETSTGNVNGTLLSDKVYIVSTSTGVIDVPKTIEGGRCEISTGTGDIKISVVGK